MSVSKFLAIIAVPASLILIMAAPSYAQQGKTTQNVRSSTTPPLATGKPYVRPVATTARDHRKSAASSENAAGGTMVTPGRKRTSSTCIKSLLGGPCVGGIAGKALAVAHKPLVKIDGGQMFFREEKSKNKKRPQTVDHRKK
jgi:hypothetical protein